MSFQLILLLVAGLAFVGLAAYRLWRVGSHREPLDGFRRIIFVLLFLLVPPIVLQFVLVPKGTDAANAVLLYIAFAVGIWAAEWAVGFVVARVAPVARRRTLLIALVGGDQTAIMPFDPPMTTELEADIAAVDRANQAFPRGAGFMAQVDRPDFQSSWQTLDDATTTLEARIAEQRRLNLGVSERAIDTANDARGRLETLRRDGGTVGASPSLV